MASYPKWDDLNKRQRRMAMKKYRARQDAAPSQPEAPPAAPKRVPPDKDPLYNPAVQLTGRDLKQAVNQIVAAQFRPTENALDRQAKSTRVQGGALADRVAGYSRQVDRRAGTAVARQEAIAARLQEALGKIGEQGQARVDDAQVQQAARVAADEQLRGKGLSGGGADAVADELAAMRARSASDSQNYQSAGAVLGANYTGLTNATRAAQQLRGTEAQGEITTRLANDLAEIRVKRAELGSQKGAERTKQLLGLRQSGFENLITTQGLGIKTAELQADIERQRKELALANRKQAEAEANNAFNRDNTTADNERADRSLSNTEQRDAYQRENKLGPYKPASKSAGEKESAAAKAIKTDVENGAVMFKELLNGKDAKGRTRTVARVEEILRKRGAPPIVVLAAGDIAQFGYVRPAHLQSLRVAGVRIPKAWRRPRGAGTYKPPGLPG